MNESSVNYLHDFERTSIVHNIRGFLNPYNLRFSQFLLLYYLVLAVFILKYSYNT